MTRTLHSPGLQARPEIVQKYPQLFNDVRQAYGQNSFDKILEERQKRVAENGDELQKLQRT